MITIESICTECGFCCDGTLFNRAIVKQNEVIDESYTFFVLPEEGTTSHSFRLPCNYLKDKFCTIYNTRPYKICENFKCKLLRSVNNSTVTFTEALKIISEITLVKVRINDNLNIYFPETTNDSLHERVVAFSRLYNETSNPNVFRKKYNLLILDSYILNELLTKHFTTIKVK